jgi:hypothetical protein
MGEATVSDEVLMLASPGLSEERPLWHLFLVADQRILFFLVPFFCAIVILFSCWFVLRQSHRRAIDDRQ